MTLDVTQPAGPLPTFAFTPDLSFAARQRMAGRDISSLPRLWRLSWTLAWLDIRLRYRGSMLGPFWLTLSTGAMIGAMGVVNAVLFNMDMREYFPYLALSLVLWSYVGGITAEGCQTFLEAEGTIRSVRMPYCLYAMRVMLRNWVVLGHNVVVVVVVYATLRIWPGANALLCLPGLLLWAVDSIAICIGLGAICSRFRDIPPIIASVIQMAFFISAVIFKPQQIAPWDWLLLFNPFFTLLEVVRAPLLGAVPSFHAWVSALGWSVALCGVSWLLFVRVRSRIAFWV